MEEEIDLRPYIEAIIKHWYWIVGTAVFAGLVAFAVSSTLPPSYEATALVAITVPEELTLTSLPGGGFNPSFSSENKSLSFLRAFPELATSDQLLQQLQQTLNPPLEEELGIEELRDILEAEAGSDPTLIRFTATHHDPEMAAQLANQWAALYVPWANTVYGLNGEEQVVFLENQLEDAQIKLIAIEENLIDFEANNRTLILQNNLTFLTEKQSELFAQHNSLQSLVQDVDILQLQIESLSDNTPISFAHQLTALNLQLSAFGAENRNAIQYQIDNDTALTTVDKTDQLAFLDELIKTVLARLTQTETELAELEPQILQLQQQLQEAETEQNRLSRNYNEAEESYIALSRKVEVERLSAENTTTGVRLASNSAVPEKPTSSGHLMTIIVAVTLFGIFAVTAILAITWWQESYQKQS